jgi:hypothetical protein
MNNDNEFASFNKIARLSREMVITEKLDGTNAQILITETGIFAGSRTRWITPDDDNHGFAAWVNEHSEELRQLGPGRHFGEWWGKKINRGYNLSDKRFSLFNTRRWHAYGDSPKTYPTQDPRISKTTTELPQCCHLVPILYEGPFDTNFINSTLTLLGTTGSHAAPGFSEPEGIIIFHVASNALFKKTFKNDGVPKTKLGEVE